LQDNGYAYAGNNPITNTDPTGLCSDNVGSGMNFCGTTTPTPAQLAAPGPGLQDWADAHPDIISALSGTSTSFGEQDYYSTGEASGFSAADHGSGFVAETPTQADVPPGASSPGTGSGGGGSGVASAHAPAGSGSSGGVNWGALAVGAAGAAAVLCVIATRGECLEFILANGGDILGIGGEAAGLGAEATGATGLGLDAAVGGFETEAEAEAEAGESSLYEDITAAKSAIRNIGTDVSKGDFEQNLKESGWDQSTSKDGQSSIFTKDGAKYTTRQSSSSTGGPSAEFFPDGMNRTLKIRLGNQW
jgi:hypothetical protein